MTKLPPIPEHRRVTAQLLGYMEKYEVRIVHGWVYMTQTVKASSPEEALDIVQSEALAAFAAGDYGIIVREVTISCGPLRRAVVARTRNLCSPPLRPEKE